MEQKQVKYKSKRQREREEMKGTFGYKIWLVMFTILYPFIAVFTFLFSGIVMVFSTLSRAIYFIISKFYARP